ncbi:MAG: hypothetical protein ABI151_10210 [Chitinophagaceae bacterium]
MMPLHEMTRLSTFVILISFGFAACNNSQGPDVSAVKISAPIERFDDYFFTKFDTTNARESLVKMQTAYPYFTRDFITNILGLPLGNLKADSIPAMTISEIKRFKSLTQPIYGMLSARFRNTATIRKGIEIGFSHLHYYYPAYRIPRVVMYLGPFNAPGVALTNDALAIGLQLFAGKDFSFYTTPTGMEMFPAYISRTFEPEYIPANCMKVIIGDLYLDRKKGRPLIEEMIEKGKDWYLLNKLLPGEADSLKTGFTASQLNFCEKSEGMIWNAILQGSDLYTTDPTIIQNYIGESPKTPGMPDAAPGNIGQWIGYRIVMQYASKNEKLSPDEIMKTDPAKLFAESKYKPR